MQYFKDTLAEMKHVRFPSRQHVWSFTGIVIVLSLVIAYYLGLFDFIFSRLLGLIL